MLLLAAATSAAALPSGSRKVFALEDPTGTLRASLESQGAAAALLRIGSLENAPEAKRYSRSWTRQPHDRKPTGPNAPSADGGKEIDVLIITGATTGKIEANNTAIKNIKRTARGYRNADIYKSVSLLRSAVRAAALRSFQGSTSPLSAKSPKFSAG
jgi:transposase